MSNRFFKRNKLHEVFNIKYSVWKTTFKTIYQLSCFVGHPVHDMYIVQNTWYVSVTSSIQKIRNNLREMFS